jgi:hypothetical protein
MTQGFIRRPINTGAAAKLPDAAPGLGCSGFHLGRGGRVWQIKPDTRDDKAAQHLVADGGNGEQKAPVHCRASCQESLKFVSWPADRRSEGLCVGLMK